jgi:hypothetical protein
MPHDSPGSLFFVRLLQYRISAASGDLGDTAKIAARFDEEFPQASRETAVQLSRFTFLSQMVVFDEDIDCPIQVIVSRATQLMELAEQLSDILSHAPIDENYPDPMVGPGGKRDYALFASWTLAIRLNTTDKLIEALDALERIGRDEAKRLLWGLGLSESKARMLLDRIWLSEHRAESSDWTKYRKAMQRIYALAQRHDVASLALAAAKITIRVTDEDLEDSDGALSLYDRFAGDLGEKPSLLDARARVLSRRGKDLDAVALWTKALPDWRADEDDLAPSYAYRDAALAASRLDDWSVAAGFLSEAARKVIVTSEQDSFRAGLLIDAGFAWWKGNNSAQAVEQFSAGLGIIDRLQDRAAAEPIRSVQRRAGHTLMWVASVTEGKRPKDFVEPPAACCSNLDPLPGMPTLTPIDFIVDYLLRFERGARTGDACWERYNQRLRRSPYCAVRVTHADLSIRRCLERLSLEELLSAAVDLSEGLALAKRHRDAGLDVNEELAADASVQPDEAYLELIRSFLLFGVYAAAARGDLAALPLERWRQNARSRGIESSVEAFLRTADQLFVSRSSSAWEATAQPPTGEWVCQGVGAIALSIENDTDPRQMIQGHGVLVGHLSKMANRDLIADDLARIVSQAWQRLSERPFLLRNPRHSVPEIKAAINSNLAGWRKARAVLQAALPAVALPSADRARSIIMDMPDE